VTKGLKKNFRGAGRVAFLARLEDIKKRNAEGYPLFAIYQEYEKQLNISYSQFARYASRYMKRNYEAEKMKAIFGKVEKDSPSTDEKPKGSTLDNLKAPIKREDII
jgi:hypothetical protein